MTGSTHLYEAMAWVGDHGLSGALEVVGDRTAGVLYFSDGHLCFALLGGESCVPASGAGIDPALWLQALASPAAEIDFGAALMLAGVAERQVQRFARRSIDTTLAGLGRNHETRIHFVDRPSPFGSMFRFHISNWTDLLPSRHPSVARSA